MAFGNVETHKSGNPLHLITSCCGTAIERLSAFTEHYLKPLAQELPSFIKDTTHLINKIEHLNRFLFNRFAVLKYRPLNESWRR